MCSVSVYGFGSAFAKVVTASDIDMLVIHARTDADSCNFAIECKRFLEDYVVSAHVTMLSSSEEAYFQFIKCAQAISLGSVRKSHREEDFEALLSEVHKRAPQSLAETVFSARRTTALAGWSSKRAVLINSSNV